MEIEVKDFDQNTISSAQGELEAVCVDGLRIENFVDVTINKDITLHITHSPDGYLVDCYKYLNPEDNTEEHDFDSDFLGNISVDNEDLEPENI